MPALYFSPKDLKILADAYKQACHALRFAFFSKETKVVEQTQSDLAKIVIEVSKTVEREPDAISKEALRRMPPLQAEWKE